MSQPEEEQQGASEAARSRPKIRLKTSRWTDDRIDYLINRWAQCVSATAIALEMGPPFTRSAVVGQARRLGLLTRREKSDRARKLGLSNGRHHKNRLRRQGVGGSLIHEPVDEASDHLIPIEQRCTLMELDDCKCRWPVGDPAEPGFFFCGAPVSGTRYCEAHHRGAHESAQDKAQ